MTATNNWVRTMEVMKLLDTTPFELKTKAGVFIIYKDKEEHYVNTLGEVHAFLNGYKSQPKLTSAHKVQWNP